LSQLPRLRQQQEASELPVSLYPKRPPTLPLRACGDGANAEAGLGQRSPRWTGALWNGTSLITRISNSEPRANRPGCGTIGHEKLNQILVTLDIPVRGFTGHSCPVSVQPNWTLPPCRLATGKSPEPADRNVCATPTPVQGFNARNVFFREFSFQEKEQPPRPFVQRACLVVRALLLS